MSSESPAANPYRPPVTAENPESTSDDGRRRGRLAARLLGAAIALIVLTFPVIVVLRSAKLGGVGFMIATGVAIAGFVSAIGSFVQAARSRESTGSIMVWAVLAAIGNGLMSLFGAVLALFATAGFSRGRQLRRLGRVLLPTVGAGGAWAELPIVATIPDGVRRGLAAQWRENGRTEHASVAAFARLTLDLMALGAPPALVAASNRDALDEIRHTELCFSLARALDGEAQSPGAFPEAQRARTLPGSRSLALCALAVDSLVDGALHEGVSARVIAQLAKRCEDPQIRAVLKEIAADEGRHAAHGWDVVRWCLAEGGTAVAEALRGAVAVLPQTVRTTLPEAAADGGWERFGVHGHALEAEELASTRADLVRRVAKMIGEDRRAAA